jgi:hypothetical protein
MNVIELIGVHKSFNEKNVINGVDLALKKARSSGLSSGFSLPLRERSGSRALTSPVWTRKRW